jgi:hypothetical protein
MPFVDLIALTARYINHRLQKDNLKLNTNTMAPDEFFDDILDNFRLIIFSTYVSNEGTIFYEECNKLNRINQKYGMDVFHYHLRMSKDGTKWDRRFMNESLYECKDEIEKVYLVGPVNFMDDIKDAISKSDLNVYDKIFLV